MTVAAVAAATAWSYQASFGSRSQLFGAFPFDADVDQPDIALTFDDGPNEPHTSRLLDTLADRGVKATFFQVGRCAERFPETSRRVVASGHTLGNHSYNHSFGRYLTEPQQLDEIERAQDALHRITGQQPTLYRPPWLCHWPWVLRSVAANELQVVSGTFAHPLEVLQPPAAAMTARAARVAKPGSILIFHDGREARGGSRAKSVAAIGPLIDRLHDRGFSFTTVDRLLGVSAYR